MDGQDEQDVFKTESAFFSRLPTMLPNFPNPVRSVRTCKNHLPETLSPAAPFVNFEYFVVQPTRAIPQTNPSKHPLP